jgi:hypothetical protein
MMSAFRNWGGKAAVLLLPIVLGGCAQYAQQYSMTTPPPGTGPLAWDGAGRDPNLAPSPRHARHATPAVAESASEPSAADADAQLARKLVICSTCIKPTPAVATASAANRQDVASITNR